MKEFNFPHPCVQHHLCGENDAAAVRKVEGEYPAIERPDNGLCRSHRGDDDCFATCRCNSLRGASGGRLCGRNQQDAFILLHDWLPYRFPGWWPAGRAAVQQTCPFIHPAECSGASSIPFAFPKWAECCGWDLLPHSDKEP